MNVHTNYAVKVADAHRRPEAGGQIVLCPNLAPVKDQSELNEQAAGPSETPALV